MGTVTHIIRYADEEDLPRVLLESIERDIGVDIEGIAVNPDYDSDDHFGILFVDGRKMILRVMMEFSRTGSLTIETKGRWLPYVEDEAGDWRESND